MPAVPTRKTPRDQHVSFHVLSPSTLVFRPVLLLFVLLRCQVCSACVYPLTGNCSTPNSSTAVKSHHHHMRSCTPFPRHSHTKPAPKNTKVHSIIGHWVSWFRSLTAPQIQSQNTRLGFDNTPSVSVQKAVDLRGNQIIRNHAVPSSDCATQCLSALSKAPSLLANAIHC